jgi:hypothetical protein
MTPVFDPFDEPSPEKPLPKPLPVGKLKDLDLDQELFSQYHRAKNLLEAAEFDPEVGLSGKVSAMNSIVSILAQITKLQSDLYNAQTVAKIESSLIDTLKAFPEIKEAFLKAYEKC